MPSKLRPQLRPRGCQIDRSAILLYNGYFWRPRSHFFSKHASPLSSSSTPLPKLWGAAAVLDSSLHRRFGVQMLKVTLYPFQSPVSLIIRFRRSRQQLSMSGFFVCGFNNNKCLLQFLLSGFAHLDVEDLFC